MFHTWWDQSPSGSNTEQLHTFCQDFFSYTSTRSSVSFALQKLNEEDVATLACRRLAIVAAMAFNTATLWPSPVSQPLNSWGREPSRVSTITSGLAINQAACVRARYCEVHSFIPLIVPYWLFQRVFISSLDAHSLLLLQLHGSVRDYSLSKLPGGVRQQSELCVADYLWRRQPDPSALLWLRPGATVWLAGGERWRYVTVRGHLCRVHRDMTLPFLCLC